MTGAPNKATPFPVLPIQKCSASSEPSALSLSLVYSGDGAHQRSKGRVALTPSLTLGTEDRVCLPRTQGLHLGGEVDKSMGIPCTTEDFAMSIMVRVLQ